MAFNGHSGAQQAENAVMNNHHGEQNMNGQSAPLHSRLPHRNKLPTIDQALRLSPFSSILPFSAEMIPMPNAEVRGCVSAFSNQEERQHARQQLDWLNADMSRSPNQSGPAARAAQEINNLLNSDDITDFKFKTLDKVHHDSKPAASTRTGDNTNPRHANLSPFAKNIYQRAQLDHRLPTPVSPSAAQPSVNGSNQMNAQKVSPQATTGALTPQVVVPTRPTAYYPQTVAPAQASSNSIPTTSQAFTNPAIQLPNGLPGQTPQSYSPSQAFIENGLPQSSPQSGPRMVATAVQIPSFTPVPYQNGAQVQGPRTPSPQVTPGRQDVQSTSKQTPLPMVVIPPASGKALHSDFVTLESAPPDSVSRKRKRGFGDASSFHAPETRDQKDVADHVVRQFADTLEDIFEADDQSPPNSHFLVSVKTEDHEVHTLNQTMHVKLDQLLQKINTFGRLADIPLDDLQRLQSLSLAAVTTVTSQEFDFGPNSSLDDSESVIQGLDVLSLGLRASRTILLTMSGGREEKSLYSEDSLLSIKTTLEKVADSCIIPVVEARMSTELFDALSVYRKPLSQVVYDSNKVLNLLTRLLAKEEMAETVITTIEYFMIRIMFVENASNDKDSILGVSKYETLRRTAMDMIAIMFSRYPAERKALLNDILSSLQKLPTTRQAARQYRLRDGRAIQLVTALIIQLVQASSTVSKPVSRLHQIQNAEAAKSGNSPAASSSGTESDDDSSSSEDGSTHSKQSTGKERTNIQTLKQKAAPLCDAAAKSAHQVVHYLISRAQTSTKSGDEPHRQLLDIFVEDILTVMSLPEWPGAEMLVRAVCIHALKILDNPKSLAPAKNMSLELLGIMGSAISDLIANTRTAIRNQEHSDSALAASLSQMFEDFSDGSLEITDLLVWDGPYHIVAEHLEQAAAGDLQTSSAHSYYVVQWAKSVSFANLDASEANEKLATRLSVMVSGQEWISSDRVDSVPASLCNIAYSLTLLNTDFCRRLDYMLKILLDSVTSEQTTVRSRGLKSVTQMLEKDPSILDRARSVKLVILKCASDTSPMVRDAALTLIGKCINLKPALEAELLPQIMHLSNDAAVGVRKRSLKLSRDVYLRNHTLDNRAAISDILIQRVTDQETSVVDLARQTFEEIWIAPFFGMNTSSGQDAQADIALRNHLLLIVRTVTRRKGIPPVLVSLFQHLLSTECKNSRMNFKVLKGLVKSAFDIMVDSVQAADSPKQGDILETLTVFAHAEARLFESSQLQILQPYIGNLASREDLDIFRPVVVIFRCVLPVLSSFQQYFLEDIRSALLKCVSKLFKTELNEVAQCLWAINDTLQNPESLIKLVASVIRGLNSFRETILSNAGEKENMAKVRKYMHIAGLFGKHCDFEKHVSTFRSILPWFKGDSIAGLIITCLKPFASKHQPLALQAVAIDCIGLICQSKPSQFQQNDVDKIFVNILQHGESDLQEIVLSTFRDFFTVVEQVTVPKTEDNSSSTGEDGQALTKLGSSMKADKRDEASSLISQYFLEDILPIALASQDSAALTATEVIASINRQGAAFPKQSIPTLVALGTSKIASIATIALEEHRRQHQLHETMFEGEYMKGIQEAFQYQRKIFNDPLGFSPSPITSKLSGLWDVVKTSKAKFQKKFITNFCARIDFEPSKLDMSQDPSTTLQFSRFLTENLAFFDYTRLEELLHTIACMEKIVADTGSGVAHSISTEVFHVVVKEEPQSQEFRQAMQQEHVQQTIESGSQPTGFQFNQSQAADHVTHTPIDPGRLKQLTTAAVILSALWDSRTYLRRLYGQNTNGQRREGRGRPATKDLTKAPSKAQGVSAEKLVATIADKVASLENNEAMIQQCRDFVELLSVDSEVKVKAEDEDSYGDRSGTPLVDDDAESRDTPMSGASRGTKRKGSLSASVTPTKKRGRPPLGRRKSTRKSTDGDDSNDEWN